MFYTYSALRIASSTSVQFRTIRNAYSIQNLLIQLISQVNKSQFFIIIINQLIFLFISKQINCKKRRLLLIKKKHQFVKEMIEMHFKNAFFLWVMTDFKDFYNIVTIESVCKTE